MLKLLRRLFNGSVKERVLVVPRDSSTITADEWRTNPNLVTTAATIVGDPNFRLMIDTARNTHDQRLVLPDGCALDHRAIIQAEAQGFNTAIMLLLSLAKPLQTEPLLEPTFEPPDYKTTD